MMSHMLRSYVEKESSKGVLTEACEFWRLTDSEGELLIPKACRLRRLASSGGFRQHLHGFSSQPICLKMAYGGVLLYCSDEHISSHIDE
ncbi:hypothetical protein V6N12_045853 [Hibiscus sabdariffa]|uniref:Uncharacterized protein n=1 Tax=Hibiscus sabdariffa TaxID=183260 RepID=A0ABR2G3W9_9ROSI